MFSIEFTRDLDFLLSDAPAWDRLTQGVPFRESAWLGPWWRAFGTDKKAHVLIARDEAGEIRGILPLYRTESSETARTLSMIGDGEACSDHVSVLAAREDSVEIARLMGEHLARTASDHHLQGWDLIDIDGVVEGDQAMSALARGLKEGGARLHAQSRMSVWFKPADSCWDEHLKHHGKTQRRQMRRMREKLDAMEKIVATTDEQIDELLGAVIDMHQRRWNAVGEPGSFANPAFREFIFVSAKQFAAHGRLHLRGLKVDGKIIAGELNMIGCNRILYSYSAGYDIDHADLEPGRLICIDGLLELYRSGLVGLDFMRGDESYKTRLATESHRLFRVRAVAPALLPRLRHAAWCTGFELKQWVRRRQGRPLVVVQDPTTLYP